MEKVRVLFVCLGNICRSPMAEGIFLDKISQAGIEHHFEVDSAGTGSYHIGELPDKRMRTTGLEYGIELTSRARQILHNDLYVFDHILAMDGSNRRDILALSAGKNFTAEVELMRNYDPTGFGSDVPDPYFGGEEGFHEVYSILDRSVHEFLKTVREKHNI